MNALPVQALPARLEAGAPMSCIMEHRRVGFYLLVHERNPGLIVLLSTPVPAVALFLSKGRATEVLAIR